MPTEQPVDGRRRAIKRRVERKYFTVCLGYELRLMNVSGVTRNKIQICYVVAMG